MREFLRQHYGSITNFETFGVTFVEFADAESAKKVLTAPSDILVRSDFALGISKGLFRYALFILPTSDVWKKHRKFLQPGFGPAHLRHTVDASNEIMDQLSELWDARFQIGDNTTSTTKFQVNLFQLASSITIDVIGHVAFSYRYDSVQHYEEPERQKALKAYNRAFEIMLGRIGLPLESMWGWYGVGIKDAERDIGVVKEAVLKAIENKRALMTNGEDGEDGVGKVDAKTLDGMTKLDVLDRLLEVKDWTDEEIVDEVVALFLAGGETSANTIVFAILELYRNPECLAKLLAELDSHLGKPKTSEPTEMAWESLSQLPYLERVIKETLRLHPILPLLGAREVVAKEGIEIMGHRISQGTLLAVDVRGIHRSPKYWPEPLKFNPDRWIDLTPEPGTYLPFAEGPHMCLGYKMAMLELKVVIARLVHRYKFTLVEDQKLNLVTSLTHGYKDGILFDVETRA
jgi:cytochrome P450